MGRRNEELEAERTYELIKREKENSGTCVKSFLKFLFSQVGLVLLCAAIAVVGKLNQRSILQRCLHLGGYGKMVSITA